MSQKTINEIKEKIANSLSNNLGIEHLFYISILFYDAFDGNFLLR